MSDSSVDKGNRTMTTQPVVRMVGITKIFPGVVANDSIDFDLRPGEIHTLLGENGAGKSTLMSVLSGMFHPDSGTIEVNGETTRIQSPFDSLKLGIAMVYQHFALVPPLTVLENIILGFEDGKILDLKKAEEKVERISKEYGLSVDLRARIWDLSVGEQQRVEIVKALYRGSNVLILDEPTSVLTPLETEEFFKTIFSLRELGKSVVFITHKLGEAFRISDRISILRLGKKVAEFSGEDLRRAGEKEATNKILDKMFGGMPVPEGTTITKSVGDETVILDLEDIVCLNNRGIEALKGVSLKIRKGEIFGIAGVDGNGQKELAEVIAGQRRIVSGRISLEGDDVTHLDVAPRFDRGISYITDERMREGCVGAMSLAENSILRLFRKPPFSRWTVIDNGVVNKQMGELIEAYEIKAPGPGTLVNTLSGGNIQKVLLARELLTKPKIIVCNKPTHGLDARTTYYIRERLREESSRGAAVLLISPDMDELLSQSDRIGVIYGGEILAVVDQVDATPEGIGRLMLGIRD